MKIGIALVVLFSSPIFGATPLVGWKTTNNNQCDLPQDLLGNQWFEPSYQDGDWSWTVTPFILRSSAAVDYYFRGSFKLETVPSELKLSFASDDGLWLYVNGEFLGHWGGGCHRGGCVNQPTICGRASLAVPAIDIAPLVVIGENFIAAQVSNWNGCCDLYFSADLLQWQMSELMFDCDGPVDGTGQQWWEENFDDASWQETEMPHSISYNGATDRYYRSTVELKELPTEAKLQVRSDDGLQLYLNGELLGDWIGCHTGGCVNFGQCGIANRSVNPIEVTALLKIGKNVIAAHVSNAWAAGAMAFDCGLTIKRVTNPCANGVKDSEEEGVDCGGSCATPCSQLEVYDHDAGVWVKSANPAARFQPDFGTAVLVHGFNPSDSIELQEWMLNMATAISIRRNKQVNILGWNWMKEAETIIPTGLAPGYKAKPQGKLLAGALKNLFTDSDIKYSQKQPIHLMGHSLGAYVVAWCGSLLIQPEYGSYFVNQVTLWDPPDNWEVVSIGHGVPDIRVPISDIRANSQKYIGVDTYIELYDGPANFGTHKAHLFVDTPYQPILGHDVHDWYEKTIRSPVDVEIRNLKGEVVVGKTIGYGTTDSDKQPEAILCTPHCQQETVVVQYVDWTYGQKVFKLQKDCSNCETFGPQSTAEYLIDGEEIFGSGDAIINGSSLSLWLEKMPLKKQKGSELLVSCAFPVLIAEDWDYVSFDYEFAKVINTAILAVLIQVGEDIFPCFQEESASQLVSGHSGFLLIKALKGQLVKFIFELRSEDVDVRVDINNFSFSQDVSAGNQPPIANAGPDAIYEVNASNTAKVVLSGAGSTDPEGGYLWLTWLEGENYVDDGVEVALELTPGTYTFTLEAKDEFGASDTDEVTIIVNAQFVRGDVNQDQAIDIGDVIVTLAHLFLSQEVACQDACDANDSGELDLVDALYLLNYLFLGGSLPLPPFPDLGPDPTLDELICRQ